MKDMSFSYKVEKAVEINGKPYNLYLRNDKVVYKNIKDFINKKNPIKLLVDIRNENAFSFFLRNYKDILKSKGRDLGDNIPLPMDELIMLMNNVPTIKLKLLNADVEFVIDCFQIMPFNYKQHYRYKWLLSIGDKALTQEELKRFKDIPKDELKNYYLVFVKNVSPMNIEKVERSVKEEDFIPIKLNLD